MTLFPTSCHVPSTHQKQSHFIQVFLPRLQPPSLVWQVTAPKEFHRAEPILWLFCLKNPTAEVDAFFFLIQGWNSWEMGYHLHHYKSKHKANTEIML